MRWSFLLLMSCTASAAEPDGPGERYRYSPASRDGIGKFYQGREISHVMGHLGAGWLERESRVKEEAPEKLIEALPLAPDSVVADIGAGTGYFSFRISPRVPKGMVYAVDIQPEMIGKLRSTASKRGIRNVKPILSTESNPRLPPGAVDLALMVDAYHEFAYPYEMMTELFRALKPGGRAVLVEYRGEDPTIAIKPLHKMTEAQAIKEMQLIGFHHEKTLSVLPVQHILVFRKPQSPTSTKGAQKKGLP
ncbi:MAG: class I SAM-dependent methyltransferase [Myxococcota bacterium]